MKQIYLTLLLAVMSLFTSQPTSAYDFEVDGIYYSVTSIPNMTVSVSQKNEGSYKKSTYQGNIIIPQYVIFQNRKFLVTSISGFAFYDCKLSSIYLPESIEEIDDDAFYRCEVEKIKIPSKVRVITGFNFSKIPNILLNDSITRIASRAFQNSEIESITIPASVNDIGDYAFDNCSKLHSIFFKKGNNKLTIGKSYGESYGTYTGKNTGSDYDGSHTIIERQTYYRYPGFFHTCKSLRVLRIGRKLSYDWTKEVSRKLVTDGSTTKVYDVTYNSYNSPFTDLSIDTLYLGIDEYLPYENAKFIKIECEQLEKFNVPISVKHLVLSENTNEIGANIFSECQDIDTIEVRRMTPIHEINTNSFSNASYMNATLIVPTQSLDLYKEAPVWKLFWKIVAKDYTTAITFPTLLGKKGELYYNLQGQIISTPQKGINIIKYSDGTTKKVIIK